MMFFQSIQGVLTIILILGLGYFLKKFKWVDDKFGKSISSIVVKIALPLDIFVSVLKNLDKNKLIELSSFLIYPIITVVISYVIAYAIVKIFRIKRGRRGIFMNAVANANTIFIGLPLNIALFGSISMPFFLICYISNTISTWIFGVFLIANDSESVKENKLRIKKILSPPLIGFLIGIIFLILDIKIPVFLNSTFTYLGHLVTPLALIYIGIMLCDSGLINIRFDKDTILALIGRFIIAPLIMIVILVISIYIFNINLPLLLKQTFIVQSATPMLAVLPILASEYNCDVKYATNLVTISTLLFVIVIPILMLITQFI